MFKEKLSVIIPVYNVELYLHKCIDSVREQSYTDLEILLIDDGSTDKSGSICDEYALLDDRIIVFHQENAGLSLARNVGLNHAQGDLITFLDADDWVDRSMYMELITSMKEHDVSVASCGVKYIFQDKEVVPECSGDVWLFNQDESIKGLLTNKYIRFEVWNKIYTRSIIGDTRFKAGQIYEDVYFTLCILQKNNRLVYIDKPMYNYLRIRYGNTNTRKFTSQRLEVVDEFDILANEFDNLGMTESANCIRARKIKFMISLYTLGKDVKADKQMLNSIYVMFKKSYREIQHNKNINMAVFFLFYFNPELFLKIRKIKKLEIIRSFV
jgi:glycosyltransferase involved in cell wall biosynthesis